MRRRMQRVSIKIQRLRGELGGYNHQPRAIISLGSSTKKRRLSMVYDR